MSAVGSPLSVVHVIDSAGLYGAEQMLLTLAAQTRARGHEATVVTLVSPEDTDDPLGRAAEAAGLEARPLLIRDGLRLRAFAELLHRAVDEGADIVHAHGYRANVLLALTRRHAPNLGTVGTLHGWTARSPLSRMAVNELAERLLVHRLDRVVVVNPAMSRRLPPVHRDRVVWIHNGVPLEPAEGSRACPALAEFIGGRPAILAVGRLSAEKGFDLLINAASRLVRQGTDAALVIAGEGVLREDLQRQIEELDLTCNVMLAGYLANIRQLMPMFDLLALSSHTEGLPLVVLEAMAHGLPVVATDVGMLSEVVSDECGRLVQPGSADALTTALVEVLQDQDLRQGMGHKGRERVTKHFSATSMGCRYLEVYRVVARSHNSTHCVEKRVR